MNKPQFTRFLAIGLNGHYNLCPLHDELSLTVHDCETVCIKVVLVPAHKVGMNAFDTEQELLNYLKP